MMMKKKTVAKATKKTMKKPMQGAMPMAMGGGYMAMKKKMAKGKKAMGGGKAKKC